MMVYVCLKLVCGKYNIQQRYVVCFMVFLGLINDYTTRNCLNIAMTEMVASALENLECPSLSKRLLLKSKTYSWEPDKVASVLSSFFLGYVVMHIPGGFLATRYGGKHVFGLGVLASAVLCSLSPIAVDYGGYRLLCLVRFFIGFVQGSLFPAVGTLLSKWVPRKERGRLAGMVLAGSHIGTIICNAVSGYIISVSRTWEWVFYFWALVASVWYFFYLMFCYSDPSQSPYISQEEQEELVSEFGVTTKCKIPWVTILCYKPVIALMVGEIGHSIVLFFVVVNLPKYFKDVLKFNVVENGVLTSLPNVGVWIFSTICGILADWSINNGYAEVLTIRKVYTTIGSIFSSWCLVLAGYSGCSRVSATIMFVVAMCFKGPSYPGLKINHLDITRNFTGIVSAYVNSIGSLSYYPLSYIIASIAKEVNISASACLVTRACVFQNLIVEWLVIFWIIFFINAVAIFVYDSWASADRAQWDVI